MISPAAAISVSKATSFESSSRTESQRGDRPRAVKFSWPNSADWRIREPHALSMPDTTQFDQGASKPVANKTVLDSSVAWLFDGSPSETPAGGATEAVFLMIPEKFSLTLAVTT